MEEIQGGGGQMVRTKKTTTIIKNIHAVNLSPGKPRSQKRINTLKLYRYKTLYNWAKCFKRVHLVAE